VNILVSGSAGFIASHLIEKLLDQDQRIIGIDNFCDFYDPKIKRKNSEEQVKNSKFKLYEGDLRDYELLEKIFSENHIEIIIHLAAMAGVRPSVENPRLYNEVNNASTINLLDLAVKHKIKKFIFASSSSVYGSRSSVPFREDEDISKPISPYAATKVAGEAMVHAMSHLHGIPSICLRFFTVYGPRQRPDLAIHKFAKLIRDDKEIPVYGDGSAKRDFTYIDDLIEGILKSIEHNPKNNFDIFNLGESQTTDVNSLIQLLERGLNKKAKIKYLEPIPGDVPITYADISKSRQILGYNPQTKIEEGMIKFISWFQSSNP
jgi:UDP-glucuronate 4-epimerase